MPKRIYLSAMLVWVCVSTLMTHTRGQKLASSDADDEHTKWIREVIDTVDAIKPGMTGADLQGLFDEDGGIQFRTQGTYGYKSCRYIKIDVTFAPADNDPLTFRPQDKILKVSRPYLEYPTKD